MDILGIGKVIETEQHRDAVHMAIAPVTAAERLSPGQHVGFIGDVVGAVKQPMGIVDPFLDGPVFKGEKFWMFLYPGSITSLRHEWSHPGFPDAQLALVTSDDPKEVSRVWIVQFSALIDQTYNCVMEAANEWLLDGEYTYDNTESYKDHWDKFPEFWKHYEIVTGAAVPQDKRDSFFTCSC